MPPAVSSDSHVSRRALLGGSVAAASALVLTAESEAQAASFAEPAHSPREAFFFCLNTSTIRGQELGLPAEIELAARAGYHGLEPWIREIEAYVLGGGSLSDLAKRLRDSGLVVASAIGFAPWIVDDDAQRQAALEQAKREMDLVAQLGGNFIAAPPAGATKERLPDLLAIAERYRALIEAGRKVGVIPQLEIWGHSATLSRLGEAVCVAVEAGLPESCLLPDVYHIFRGGSDFTGLRMIAGDAIHVFHVNDYPAAPDRTALTDADRVYPGDGVAPLGMILRDLYAAGFQGMLSLELFNRGYWEQDAYEVARTGAEKMRECIERAFG